jgi:hypothetical protein
MNPAETQHVACEIVMLAHTYKSLFHMKNGFQSSVFSFQLGYLDQQLKTEN